MERGFLVTVIASAYDAGHRGRRMGAGPDALLAAGLNDELVERGAEVKVVEVAPDPSDWHSELRTGFALQRKIARVVIEARQANSLPVLLSGDCNASVGVIAGLQATGGKPAFLWCDAHADFHTPETDVFGSLDCHGLSMLTGRAWRTLSAQAGFRPLPDDQIVLVGARDVDPAEEAALVRSGIARLSRSSLRDRYSRDEALIALAQRSVTGVHLHVDADVLDPSIAPANDFAAPDGLLGDDLDALLQTAVRHLALESISVSSYDPRLDPERALTKTLVGHILRACELRSSR